MSESFAPLFFNDHVVAVGAWLLFYIIEAVAIVSVLNRYPNDSEAAGRAVRKLVTLPKKMLPVRLNIIKRLLLAGKGGLRPLAATASLAAPALSFPRSASQQAICNVKDSVTAKNVITAKDAVTAFTDAPPAESPVPGVVDPWALPQPKLPQPKPKETLQDKRAKLGLRPGQLDNSHELIHRQKELAGRRSYLQNFWYAVGISENVKEKPVGVEILGEKVVLYRGTDGSIHCLSDVCPHRGAPLHLGWMSEVNGHDCIVCPYHGWAFDDEGKLRDVPAAETNNEWPKKPLVDSFPVQEKGGFIWLFYGSKDLPEDERPPIPYAPELDDPAWRPVYGEIEFECNHWSVFENAIDMAHIHYLHDDSFGNTGKPQIHDMTCSTDAYGINASFGLHNKPVNALWEFSKVPQVKVTAQAMLPSTSVIGFTLGQGLSFITFVNTVPISANRTVNRFALVRRLDVDPVGSWVFNMSAWDKAARQAMIKILTQDKAMVEKLQPEMLGREISVKADLPQMAFRKLRQEYIDMGYGVNPDTVTERFRSDM
jgi:phenylpropionate dioxygenase-like ring-hydroxylating dioxygenase large terminal subunit